MARSKIALVSADNLADVAEKVGRAVREAV